MDDQLYNIMALKTILRFSLGIKNLEEISEKAMDGNLAVDMVKSNVEKNELSCCDYDIILMDCNMPQLDGYQAC